MTLPAWILSLMLAIQPSAPWRASYEDTADAIARVVESSPSLFAGDKGRERTAAVLVAVGWHESRFNPSAIGDHGRSYGIYQASRVPLVDVEAQTRGALAAMGASFHVCGARRAEDWLAQYASGGAGCTNVGGLIASRHRMGLAMRLWREHPFVANEIAQR